MCGFSRRPLPELRLTDLARNSMSLKGPLAVEPSRVEPSVGFRTEFESSGNKHVMTVRLACTGARALLRSATLWWVANVPVARSGGKTDVPASDESPAGTSIET